MAPTTTASLDFLVIFILPTVAAVGNILVHGCRCFFTVFK